MIRKFLATLVGGIGTSIAGGALLAASFPEWAPYREGLPADKTDLTPPIVAVFGAQFSAILGFVAVVVGLVVAGAAIRTAFRHDLR